MNVTEERQRYIMLCWDEMKIKEGLVFNKHTCELVGFTDIGDINDLNFLEQDTDSPQSRDVASHVLLFMVRGLFTNVDFPYVHFATKNASADISNSVGNSGKSTSLWTNCNRSHQ